MNRISLEKAIEMIDGGFQHYRSPTNEEYKMFTDIGEDLAYFSSKINTTVYNIIEYCKDNKITDKRVVEDMLRYGTGSAVSKYNFDLSDGDKNKLKEYLDNNNCSLIDKDKLNELPKNGLVYKIQTQLKQQYLVELIDDISRLLVDKDKIKNDKIDKYLSSDENGGFNTFKKNKLAPLYVKEIEKELSADDSYFKKNDLSYDLDQLILDKELDSIQLRLIFTGLVLKESQIYFDTPNRCISQVATSIDDIIKKRNKEESEEYSKTKQKDYLFKLGSTISRVSDCIGEVINNTVSTNLSVSKKSSNHKCNLDELFKSISTNIKNDIKNKFVSNEDKENLLNIGDNTDYVVDEILKQVKNDFKEKEKINKKTKTLKRVKNDFKEKKEINEKTKTLEQFKNYLSSKDGFDNFKENGLVETYINLVKENKSKRKTIFIGNKDLKPKQIEGILNGIKDANVNNIKSKTIKENKKKIPLQVGFEKYLNQQQQNNQNNGNDNRWTDIKTQTERNLSNSTILYDLSNEDNYNIFTKVMDIFFDCFVNQKNDFYKTIKNFAEQNNNIFAVFSTEELKKLDNIISYNNSLYSYPEVEGKSIYQLLGKIGTFILNKIFNKKIDFKDVYNCLYFGNINGSYNKFLKEYKIDPADKKLEILKNFLNTFDDKKYYCKQLQYFVDYFTIERKRFNDIFKNNKFISLEKPKVFDASKKALEEMGFIFNAFLESVEKNEDFATIINKKCKKQIEYFNLDDIKQYQDICLDIRNKFSRNDDYIKNHRIPEFHCEKIEKCINSFLLNKCFNVDKSYFDYYYNIIKASNKEEELKEIISFVDNIEINDTIINNTIDTIRYVKENLSKIHYFKKIYIPVKPNDCAVNVQLKNEETTINFSKITGICKCCCLYKDITNFQFDKDMTANNRDGLFVDSYEDWTINAINYEKAKKENNEEMCKYYKNMLEKDIIDRCIEKTNKKENFYCELEIINRNITRTSEMIKKTSEQIGRYEKGEVEEKILTAIDTEVSNNKHKCLMEKLRLESMFDTSKKNLDEVKIKFDYLKTNKEKLVEEYGSLQYDSKLENCKNNYDKLNNECKNYEQRKIKINKMYNNFNEEEKKKRILEDLLVKLNSELQEDKQNLENLRKIKQKTETRISTFMSIEKLQEAMIQFNKISMNTKDKDEQEYNKIYNEYIELLIKLINHEHKGYLNFDTSILAYEKYEQEAEEIVENIKMRLEQLKIFKTIKNKKENFNKNNSGNNIITTQMLLDKDYIDKLIKTKASLYKDEINNEINKNINSSNNKNVDNNNNNNIIKTEEMEKALNNYAEIKSIKELVDEINNGDMEANQKNLKIKNIYNDNLYTNRNINENNNLISWWESWYIIDENQKRLNKISELLKQAESKFIEKNKDLLGLKKGVDFETKTVSRSCSQQENMYVFIKDNSELYKKLSNCSNGLNNNSNNVELQ